MKTDFANGDRLFAEDLNDNFTETDNRLNVVESDVAAVAAVPTGAVFWFGTSAAPSGYLECDGSAVSRSSYSTLFAVVGTTFGNGDGSTTFNLPDLRGEFIRGWDDGRGVDSGRVFGSSQAAGTNNVSQFQTYGSGFGSNVGSPTIPDDGTYSTGALVSNDADFLPSGTGGLSIRMKTSNDETRPRNVALLACIKF